MVPESKQIEIRSKGKFIKLDDVDFYHDKFESTYFRAWLKLNNAEIKIFGIIPAAYVWDYNKWLKQKQRRN